MKLLKKFALISLLPLVAQAEWIPIVDFDSYSPGDGEAELMSRGWIIQDGDYFGFPQCVDGTNDCTGMREIVASPYNPTGGSANSISVRATNPNETFGANSRSITAYPLPQEIPVDGKATVYFRFATEATAGTRNFALTDLIMESSDTAVNTWGDQGVAISTGPDNVLRVHQGGYVPVLIDPQDPTAHHTEINVWYEVWLHIDNQALSGGDFLGSRYDMFIRGGKWSEITHLKNTVDDFVAAEFTQWLFRRQADEPVRTFFFITTLGNPDDVIFGTDAVFVNELAMFPDEFVLTVPEASIGDEFWAGYPVDENGWADTGDWLGWVNTYSKPWILSLSLNQYIYMTEESVTSNGAWGYVIK